MSLLTIASNINKIFDLKDIDFKNNFKKLELFHSKKISDIVRVLTNAILHVIIKKR